MTKFRPLPKANILAISLLLSLGLSAALAGQPDPRFEGVWVGVETYTVYATHTQWGHAPIRTPAVIAIGDAGRVFAVMQGPSPGRYEVSRRSNGNKLMFQSRYSGARTGGTLVLSADANTLTETGWGFLPGDAGPVNCSITATFHRQGQR